MDVDTLTGKVIEYGEKRVSSAAGMTGTTGSALTTETGKKKTFSA